MALSTADRAKGSIWGVLVADALGGPVQFLDRNTFPPVTELTEVTPFNEPKGAWSDDGSLTMCLTKSLVDTNFVYQNADWVVKLVAWYEHGYLSSTDYSWDVGRATSVAAAAWENIISHPSADENADVRAAAMSAWEDGANNNTSAAAAAARKTYPTKAEGLNINLKRGQRAIDLRLDDPQHSGNGSLMRIAPLGVAFYKDVHIARRAARENSDSTHPSARCADGCALYVELVAAAMDGASKEQLARIVATADISNREFREKMAPYTGIEAWKNKNSEEVGAHGYVIPTLEAALWGFFTTDSWKEGALAVVNLGGDADSNGAVYGGLAGAFYGVDQVPWRGELLKADLLDGIINDFAEGVVRRNGSQ